MTACRCSTIASLLFVSACFPAPGPLAPPQGKLQIGADYRADAINRWVCPGDGSLVLARASGRYVLHFESLDWVLSGEDAAEVVAFGYSTTSSRSVGVGGVIGYLTTEIREGETVFVASKASGGDLVIRRSTPEGVSETKCKPVAK